MFNLPSSIFECIKQNVTICPSKSNNSLETDIQLLINYFLIRLVQQEVSSTIQSFLRKVNVLFVFFKYR
ncbi:hypothetical protein BpHYR1_000499 [Brachionus plicatilis]|uniref:Uncharacterized protein n=1 Tax=Brachionus plicatilis TaxID=10195 RepID=A0A3M7QLP6_BRAPC|nr:hypothetical protein BpHYR1_000499 [Brachionus plicatilis]